MEKIEKSDEYYRQAFREAAQAVFETLPTEMQKRAQRLGAMNNRYIGTPRDHLLDQAFDGLIENSVSELFGKAGKRRVLFVVGESGSGKTTAVDKHVSKRKQFQRRIAADGAEARPMVKFEAPKPLTLKALARKGLKEIGYHFTNHRATEADLFETWKQQLREKRVLFLAIDEFQHTLKGTTTAEIQNVADIIKSLVQIPHWPLHVVLSGVPALGNFLEHEGGDRQLKERSIIVEFREMSFPGDVKIMRKIVLNVITHDAELTPQDVESDEFIHRIIHACDGAFGSMIQLTRLACENALRLDHTTVSPVNFAAAYALATGCRPVQNVFAQPNWLDIRPENSLATLLAKKATADAKKATTNARKGRS